MGARLTKAADFRSGSKTCQSDDALRSGLLARAGLFRIAQSAADVHETAARGIFRLATATRVIREAGTRRDQSADDDVLLESPQVVPQAANCSFGEYAGGFLEGGRRDEGLGRERSFGDAEQNRLEHRDFFAILFGTFVDVQATRAVEL